MQEDAKMRKWSKVVALILAVVIAISNLPPVQLSAAAATQEPAMRFVEKSFDSSTGILTMSLEVRPTELGSTEGDPSGRYIDEVYFAFQVEPLSAEPITADASHTPINVGANAIGFVGMDVDLEGTKPDEAVWRNFANQYQGGMGERVATGFNASMGVTDNVWEEGTSGYFTSYNGKLGDEDSGVLSCYLHLRRKIGTVRQFEATEDGYVKVIDLLFQCYSGEIDPITRRPIATATNEGALFCNSIRLPDGVATDGSNFVSNGMSTEKLEKLRDQFYVNSTEEPRTYLSTGVAGFREITVSNRGALREKYHHYAYGMEPRTTAFNGNEDVSAESPSPMTKTLELNYTNMDKEFIVLGFEARLTNEYEHGEETGKKDSFYIPAETGERPHYAIPYVSEMEDLEKDEGIYSIWKPKAQFNENAVNTNVPLKYYLSTNVSRTSTTRPEEQEETGFLNGFLERLNWKFALQETSTKSYTALNTYYQNGLISYTNPTTGIETPAAELITLNSETLPRTFKVRQAYITDTSSNYYGSMVQVVQEAAGDNDIDINLSVNAADTGYPVSVTPVGVMFDFSRNTDVTYQTMELEDPDDRYSDYKTKEEAAYAPQLRISPQAANVNSYLWSESSKGDVYVRKGKLWILVEYTDPAGGTFSSAEPMEVDLHRDDVRTPAYTEISMDENYSVEGVDENYLGEDYRIDLEQHSPELIWSSGIAIYASMFDQYGEEMYDASGKLRVPEIQINPDDQIQIKRGEEILINNDFDAENPKPEPETVTTQQKINGKNTITRTTGANALSTRFNEETGVYYLIYGNKSSTQYYDANDLVGGLYKISAVYGTDVQVPATCLLNVVKAENRFDYMDSSVSLTSDDITTPQGLLYGNSVVTEGDETIHELRLRVPPMIYEGGAIKEQKVDVQFDLEEMANQWRGQESGRNAGRAYDVEAGLRDENGELWGIGSEEMLSHFVFEAAWNNADGSVTENPGIEIDSTTLKTTGKFTFSSAAGEGTYPASGSTSANEGSPLYVTIKATRMAKGHETETQTNKYRIYFVRDTGVLTTVKARYGDSAVGAQGIQVDMVVPEKGATETAQVSFLPYDQYNQPMNWSYLGSQSWNMFIDDNGKSATSLYNGAVTLTGSNNATIQLSEKTEPCEFDVYAKCGDIDTSRANLNSGLRQVVHVVVTKRPPVPASIQSITGGVIEVPVPSMQAAEAEESLIAINTGAPRITVLDQYGNVLYSKEEAESKGLDDYYLAEWKFDQMPSSPLISLATETGEVRVRSIADQEDENYGCAPAWPEDGGTVTMSVTLKSKQGAKRNITGNTTVQLRVVRNTPPKVTNLQITTDSLVYPLPGKTRVEPLSAKAGTEYVGAEDSTPLSAGQGTWTLEAVKFVDGTQPVYRTQATDPETGEPLYDEIEGDDDSEPIRIPRWIYQSPKQVENGSTTAYDVDRQIITLERNNMQIRFANSITSTDWAPVAVKLTCDYGSASETVWLPVSYDGTILFKESDPDNKDYSEAFEAIRKADSVTISSSTYQTIQIPTASSDGTEQVVERKLEAVVKDQFGFTIYGSGAANAECKWEFVDSPDNDTANVIDPPQGVTINGTTLKVTSAAPHSSVYVRASYQGALSRPQAIRLQREDSPPTFMNFLGIDELPDLAETGVPLPGFTGPKEANSKVLNNAEQVTYTLLGLVEDGYHAAMPEETIEWTVVEDVYGLVSVSGGQLTVQCTNAWIDAGRPTDENGFISIKLEACDSAVKSVKSEVTLKIKKQDSYGVYAMPEMLKNVDGKWPVYTNYEGLQDTHLLIPSMDQYEENGGPYEAHFKTTVYNQYREALSGWPVEISFLNPMTLAKNAITGLSMEYNSNAGTGVLYISPNVDRNVDHVLVVAEPFSNHSVLDTTVNKYDVYLNAGESYQAGVALGTDYFSRWDGNQPRVWDVPLWDQDPDANVPNPEAETYAEYDLKAFVHDQRGADYDAFNVEGVYPVWQIDENCPDGVAVDQNPLSDAYDDNNTFDEENHPYGKTLRAWVSNKTLGYNRTSLQKEFSVKVWANGKLEKGAPFVQTQKVLLKKEASTPTHLFFEDVLDTDEETGVGVGEGIERPGIADGPVTVPIGVLVYDNYGYTRDDVATNVSFREDVLPEGVTVEPLFSEDGGTEIGQQLMREGHVMAEIVSPKNAKTAGSLTVYTPCNLEKIELQLKSSQVQGARKILRLPIIQEEKYVASAALYDAETGQPITLSEITFRRDTDVTAKLYYVAIFDQYGDRVSEELAQTVTPVWTFSVPGEEEGTWVEYTEVDEDGNPIPPDSSERFLRFIEDPVAKTLSLIVDPSKYKGVTNVRIGCTLQTTDGEPLPDVEVSDLSLTVRKRSSSSASSASGAYLVTYLAGAHGSLAGNIVTETVLEGTTPKFVPDVIAEEGYAHRGWDLDGELINDPATLEVYYDIVLVAQYIKLSDVAFVSGYEDGSVHPLSDITRGEFARMLVGAVTNYDPETHAKYANPFEDVGEDRYYRDYIAYAYFYGIISGYEDGTFRPEEPISRAEAAGMIAKAKNIEPVSGISTFTDLNPEGWYVGFVEALGRLEILHGYGDGTFRPANHLTRAEAVTMLVRITETAPSERELEAIRRVAKVPFNDLDRKYWAMPYILRAAGVA